MSPEGITGILSGREGGLWGYKGELWAELARLVLQDGIVMRIVIATQRRDGST